MGQKQVARGINQIVNRWLKDKKLKYNIPTRTLEHYMYNVH